MGGVEVVPVMDVSAGAWLSDHLRVLRGRVRDVVPAAYRTHALISHHEDDYGGPPVGCLDARSLTVLRDILRTRTTTPGLCWFALWEGHPGLPRRWATLPKLHLPERDYLLFRAPVAEVVELAIETEYLGHSSDAQGILLSAVDEAGGLVDVDPAEARTFAQADRETGRVRSPNLWWPEDRAWVVGTDIDADDTLVAGTQEAVEAIPAHPDLDAKRVNAEDHLPERP
jgi:hypothetical protein